MANGPLRPFYFLRLQEVTVSDDREETCRFTGPGEDGAFWFQCRDEKGEWQLTNLGCPDERSFKEAMASFLEQADFGERAEDWREPGDVGKGS